MVSLKSSTIWVRGQRRGRVLSEFMMSRVLVSVFWKILFMYMKSPPKDLNEEFYTSVIWINAVNLNRQIIKGISTLMVHWGLFRKSCKMLYCSHDDLIVASFKHTLWGGKMAKHVQTTFSDAYVSLTIIVYWFKSHCYCLIWVQLTISRHYPSNDFAPNRLQAIFWTSHNPIHHTINQVSNIRSTKSQHLKDSGTVLWLSLQNPLKPDVKSRMKM